MQQNHTVSPTTTLLSTCLPRCYDNDCRDTLCTVAGSLPNGTLVSVNELGCADSRFINNLFVNTTCSARWKGSNVHTHTHTLSLHTHTHTHTRHTHTRHTHTHTQLQLQLRRHRNNDISWCQNLQDRSCNRCPAVALQTTHPWKPEASGVCIRPCLRTTHFHSPGSPTWRSRTYNHG